MTHARRIALTALHCPPMTSSSNPEGHTGGSLNMVPAFVAHLLAERLTGQTRGWLMGQGHCVARHRGRQRLDRRRLRLPSAGRYDRSERGTGTASITDFYSYAIDARGLPAAPLGSHAGPNTAGRRVRRRLHWDSPACTRAHAAAGRRPGGLPERRRLRGTARVRLGHALVARRRLRPGRARHGPERPAHRAAHADRPGRRRAVAGRRPPAQRLRSAHRRRPRSSRHRLGHLGAEGCWPTRRGGGFSISRLAALCDRRDRKGLRLSGRRHQRRAQPAAGRQLHTDSAAREHSTPARPGYSSRA